MSRNLRTEQAFECLGRELQAEDTGGAKVLNGRDSLHFHLSWGTARDGLCGWSRAPGGAGDQGGSDRSAGAPRPC